MNYMEQSLLGLANLESTIKAFALKRHGIADITTLQTSPLQYTGSTLENAFSDIDKTIIDTKNKIVRETTSNTNAEA